MCIRREWTTRTQSESEDIRKLTGAPHKHVSNAIRGAIGTVRERVGTVCERVAVLVSILAEDGAQHLVLKRREVHPGGDSDATRNRCELRLFREARVGGNTIELSHAREGERDARKGD